MWGRYPLLGCMHYLSFNHGVECQCGCQMLSLHAVLSQDRWANFKNIIWPLHTHPNGCKDISTINWYFCRVSGQLMWIFSTSRSSGTFSDLLVYLSRATFKRMSLYMGTSTEKNKHTLTCISSIFQQQPCEKPVLDSWAGSSGPSLWGTVWGTFLSSCELCSQNCECPLAHSFSQLQSKV